MFNFIKKLWSRKKEVYEQPALEEKDNEENSIDYDNELKTMEEMYQLVDFSVYPEPDISNLKEEPVLMILDDIEESEILYNVDFKNMEKKYNFNPYKEMKVVKCLNEDAGFIAYKYLATDGNKIDYAILDITLGKAIKLKSGDVLEFDGIDIAIELEKRNPNIIIMFCSVHTLNPKNPLMFSYITKYKEATGKNIKDYFINKHSDRMEAIYHYIKG